LAENAVESFLRETGISGSSFRFFNVIGSASFELADNSKGNLVPIVLNKLKIGESPIIYGNDYPTRDGTCVRDYVDVRDLAGAIVRATKYVGKLPPAINIGAGREVSVFEVISTVIRIQKVNVIPIFGERRGGDPVRLCADISLARKLLDFVPKYSLVESISSQKR
jgi:UDP-glucose 4-epimerase